MSPRKGKDTPGQEELILSAAAPELPPELPPAAPAAEVPAASPSVGAPPPVVSGVDGSGSNEHAPLAAQFREWFLDYSSYVILDRAVPHIDDGLKPVQRRVLQTLFEMDDGRFHKVANIVGATMALHPHGDASIYDTLVHLAQKDLLIDRQGNFGNPHTGDPAAAARYIEARLSRFAREVIFNPKTTVYQPSYDGRKHEPVTLPAKFPLVLALGADGIAVGLSVKILPHNIADLCHAAVQHLQGKRFRLLPDFPTGGMADFSDYRDGERGGRVKARARVEQRSKYLFAITELPWGATTDSLIESIKAAVAKGKIKVKHIEDLTADKVEILLELPQGADADRFIDQLYVFTDCELSHAPIGCVVDAGKPVFLGCSEILRRSVDRTRSLLGQELEIRLRELEDQWHRESLERIFIEERIYRRIEKSETWESVLAEIRSGLAPFVKRLRRPVTEEDITGLTEIRIKRISRHDAKRAEDQIQSLEQQMRETKRHLAHLTDYAIAWFEGLRERHAKGLRRRTQHSEIEEIDKADVVRSDRKLFVNRAGGFAGFGLRGDELVGECSELDEVLAINADGELRVSRVGDKVFLGQDIRHIRIFNREKDASVHHLIYRDGETGKAYAKRFQVGGVVRDKAYNLCRAEGGKLLYLSVHPAAGPEKVQVLLSPKCAARIKELELDFGQLEVRGRDAQGVVVTKYPVKSVRRA